MTIEYKDSKRIITNPATTSSNGSTGNGTNNGSGFTATTGLIGQGYSQASGNYAVNNQSWGLGNDGWSFNFWCIPQSASGNDYYLQFTETSGWRNVFYMYNAATENGGGFQPKFIDDIGTNMGLTSVALSNGSWNMITVTWTPSDDKYRVYKNGTLQYTETYTATNAGNFGTPNRNWYLGNYNGGTGTTYASRATNLDEWSWWTAPLSQADITELYNSGSGIKATALSSANKTKLKVYYDFNDSPNGTLTNQAPATVEQAKPTDVQDNSILIEQDTARRYWFALGTSATDEVTGGTTDAGFNTNIKGFGNKVQAGDIFVGKKITKLGLEMKNNGSAVGGNITFGVFNTTSSTPVFTFGTFAASTLTSSYQYFEQENLTGHTLTADQVLGFHASGDVSNLNLKRYNGGTGARSTLYGMYWATSGSPNWQNAGDNQDANMKVSYVNANTWTREGALDKTGLKAYWRFNETSGNIINQAEAIGSTDSADNTTGAGGSDLTTSGVTYNVSKSPMNYSLQFDGSNDYAKAGTSTSAWNFMHSTTAKWTLCFWADMTNNGSGTVLSTAATSNTNVGIQIMSTSTSGIFRARVTDAGAVVTQLTTSSGVIPQDNAMHFYKLTYDQSLSSDNMKLSVDNGTNITQTKTGNAPTDGNAFQAMYIGMSDTSNFPMAGEFAEMSIWNRVLTDAEVTAIYNSGSGVFPLF